MTLMKDVYYDINGS